MCPKRASSVPLCINWACFCRCILRCNAQALGQVHSENRVTKSTTENSKSEFQRAPPGKQNQIRAFESRVSALLRPIASKTCLGIAQSSSVLVYIAVETRGEISGLSPGSASLLAQENKGPSSANLRFRGSGKNLMTSSASQGEYTLLPEPNLHENLNYSKFSIVVEFQPSGTFGKELKGDKRGVY